MAEEAQNIFNRTRISNSMLRDSSSKIIFADNILSSQFLRDYADVEILRHIRPGDIEDVSERYVPLYSAERNSDTVKRVDISGYLSTEPDNPLEMPLYIISLVEHKTKVEYNVIMQMLRYMVHIWEDYEKEMNKLYPGISKRKAFQYPPILPIVYFEGTDQWTACTDLADRISCGALLGKYLPHFRYQLIALHDFSNEELLAKGDEISLAMMINKIQTYEDLSAFTALPEKELEGILRDTPEYLLGTMANVLRALLYHMNLPEDEVEDAVAKIKERKMGLLFENAKLDIQEERRKVEVERRKAEEARQEKAACQREAATVRQEAQQKVAEIQWERAISLHILRMLRQGASDEEIAQSIMCHFSMNEKQAAEKLAEAFGDIAAEE